MARQRHLRLTETQESDLRNYLKRRLPELDRDSRERIDADKESDLIYRNSRAARAAHGTVWAESNMPVPITAWVVDHFSSRSEDEIFARDPMVSFKPQGPSDDGLARGLDRWANFRLNTLGKTKDILRDIAPSAYRHRAQILKATYDEDYDEWEEDGLTVLWDDAEKAPVEVLGHGNIIQGRDSLLDGIDPVGGGPRLVLEADPTFAVIPGQHYWAPSPTPIRFRETKYSGARCIEVDSDCFRAPSSAKSLDECDILAEYYDKPGHWLIERFVERPWLPADRFRGLLVSGNAKKKTKSQRNDEAKENLAFDLDHKNFGVIELWLERDVLGWGRPQRIVVWMERQTQELIDYEFQKKVTPTGRHPYTAVTAWQGDRKTWWGYSIPEVVRPYQDYIDLQWNRHSFRNSINANPIVAQNPDAIVEKTSFHDLKPFDAVTLEEGKHIEDWLQAFAFPKLDLDTQELIEKAIYWVNFWLGISNLARGDYSDVPQNTTLGGQEATLREASKLSKRISRRVIAGYTEHYEKLLAIAIATMDPQEAYTYLEGDAEQLGFIEAGAIESLPVNVKLAVGRDQSTQGIQEAQLVLQIIERYFSYPPEMQLAARPVLKQSLWHLGYDNVDEMLPPMLPVAVDPMTGQPVAADPAAAPAGPQEAPPEEATATEPAGETAAA